MTTEEISQEQFVEVPEGDYRVSLEDMGLKETKTGKLMAFFKVKILEGEFENQSLNINVFLTNMLNNVVPFQLLVANKIASCFSCYEIVVNYEDDWDDYAKQFDEVLKFARKNIDSYDIRYTSSFSGSYKIKNYEIMSAYAKE